MVLSSAVMAQQRAPGGGAVGGGGGGFGGGPMFAPRVQIGIAMDRVPEALAAHANVDADSAVLILNVFDGGAAEKAGVKRFDIITHIDGEAPVTQPLIRRMLNSKEPGDEITLRVLRSGEAHEITITLEDAAQYRARAAAGGGFAGRFSPEQLQQLQRIPQGNVFAPRDMVDQTGNIRMSPEQQRQWRQQFQRQWQEHQPEIEEHLRRLRAEMDALRDTLGREWREQVREFQIDEETRERVRQWTESAADRVAAAINRAFESIEDVDVQIDIQPPQIQILRNGRERGMIVQPDVEQRQRVVERERRVVEREETQRQRGEAIERRLNGLEERLERIEGMMRRLVERQTQE